MTPRVFAVQQPTGRAPGSGAIRPTMDLTPAEEYGELRFLLREFENPFGDIDATAAEVDRALRAESFCSDDWLLLVGNPVLIGVVAATAARTCTRLRMLQWDRSRSSYRPVEVQLAAVGGRGDRG